MRRFLAVLVLVAAPNLFAQADQAITATDSPDPVVPGNNITYAVTVTNNGPNPAINGGFNLSFTNPTYVSATGPAGFTCSVFGNNVSCTNPSFAPGTANFTVVLQMPSFLINFPDGSTTASFSTSGVTPDPVGGNNSVNVTTSWDSPQIDPAISATDSPDPVAPDGNITYVANVINNGPDGATGATFSSFNNNTLRFVSATIPAGWTCTLPAVGGNPTFSCTKPTLASGETAQFTLVVQARRDVIGINDTSVQHLFQITATGDDTNDNNNTVTVQTAYVAPDADLGITVSDSPDPVTPDNNITYTATVNNAGPDTATNVSFNVSQSGNLRFQSATIPAGWNCTLPAVNAFPTFTCTNPSFANGASSVFTVVLRAARDNIGNADGTLSTVFSVNSSDVADPVPGNNTEVENTAYIAPDSDMSVTATDAPDPVAPDNNITYTATVTNAGPDAATNATFNVFHSAGLRFQSATIPAGWNCTLPAVNAAPTFSCTHPGFASGATSIFTVVARANQADFGINDGTINTVFTTGSSNADPNNANNQVTVSTAYVTPQANLGITATDSPDPVTSGNDLTYTVTVNNAGPDAASQAQVIFATHASLTFQSLVAPAGWTCTTPAVNASGSTVCTNPSLASGGTASFTLVEKVVTAGAGGTLSSVFSISASAQDAVGANNSVEVFTNWVGPTNDLSISKSTLATAAAQGSSITYSISASNAGPDAAASVQISDPLPAQLLFQSLTAPAGWSCTTPAVGANGTVTCTTASFAVGATANFTLVTTVAPTGTGAVSNSVSIGSTNPDPTPANNGTASGAVIIAGNADLGVSKTTSATSVAPGGALTYTIAVSNGGPEPAASVVMTDVLPAQLRFQAIAAPAGWTCATPAVGTNGTVTCTAATLANGATATFTLTTTVAAGSTGTINNTAAASHSGTDANGGNSAGASAVPVVVPTSADVSVTKTTAATSVEPGDVYSYNISVANAGPDPASNVTLTDVLPATLLFQSITTPAGFTCVTPATGSTGTITCTAPTLANGATAAFTLTVQAAPEAATAVSNIAVVSSATSDPNGANNTATASPVTAGVAPINLILTKTTTATSVVAGSLLTYTMTVFNAGPAIAGNVRLTDVLPAGLTLSSVTTSQGVCSGTTTVLCVIGSLVPGVTATITLNATVTATSGTISNTASVIGDRPDTNPANNTATTPAIAVASSATGIPTMSEWALLALALMLGAIAAMRMR